MSNDTVVGDIMTIALFAKSKTEVDVFIAISEGFLKTTGRQERIAGNRTTRSGNRSISGIIAPASKREPTLVVYWPTQKIEIAHRGGQASHLPVGAEDCR